DIINQIKSNKNYFIILTNKMFEQKNIIPVFYHYTMVFVVYLKYSIGNIHNLEISKIQREQLSSKSWFLSTLQVLSIIKKLILKKYIYIFFLSYIIYYYYYFTYLYINPIYIFD